MRLFVLILPLQFGQRSAPVAAGDLNGDGRQERVYVEVMRTNVPVTRPGQKHCASEESQACPDRQPAPGLYSVFTTFLLLVPSLNRASTKYSPAG